MNKLAKSLTVVLLGAALTGCSLGGGTVPSTKVKPASESDKAYSPAAMIDTVYEILDTTTPSLGTPIEHQISHYSLSYPTGERYTPGDEFNGDIEAEFTYEPIPVESLKDEKYDDWAGGSDSLYDRCVKENGEGFDACYVNLLGEDVPNWTWTSTFKWVDDGTDESGVRVSIVYYGNERDRTVVTRLSGLSATDTPAELISVGYDRYDEYLSSLDKVVDHRVQYHTPMYAGDERWTYEDVADSKVHLYYEVEPSIDALKEIKTFDGSTVYEFCAENYSMKSGDVRCRAELDLGEDWVGLFSWDEGEPASLFVQYDIR